MIQSIDLENYWLNKLSGDLVKSRFPYDNKRIGTARDFSNGFKFRIGGDLFLQLMKLSNNSLQRLQIILTAGLAFIVSQYSGNKDIIIGTSIYNQEIERDFINTVLPLRIRLDDHMTFKELLLQVRETIYEADENQNYPIEKMLQKLKIPYSKDDDFPLFDIVILLENIQNKNYIRDINPNMLFSFLHTDSSIEGILEYNSFLYKKDKVEKITVHLKQFMNQTLARVDLKTADINILTGEEKKQLLDEFNRTRTEYPKDKTIIELFEHQAEKTPDNISVVYEDNRITYTELNQKSAKLSLILAGKGIKAEMIVGVISGRSIDLVITIFAVLKAGAAYLPLDPEIPVSRIKFILEDSNITLLFIQEHLIDKNRAALEGLTPGNIISLPNNVEPDPGKITGRSIPIRPGNMAYIIYTSGSTGRPKGVVIQHRSVVNYTWWAIKQYVRGESVRFPLFTSFSFDLTVTSIFTPLLSGNSIVVYGGEAKELLLEKVIRDNLVEVVKLTPSHLKLILELVEDSFQSNIKRFIVGGEALGTRLAGKIVEKFKGNIVIYNEYGPTEATVGCMIYSFCPEADTGPSVPIGMPADNSRVFILDNNRKLVPVGVIGELYISGDGLSRGYLNRPQLTAENFIQLTLTTNTLYKTGDLARWLPDGNIEFHGRINHQVKIRGFRIECGEIENRLSSHHGVKDAVVIARKVKENIGTGDISTDTESYLCAYIMPVSPGILDLSQIRDWLAAGLPGYMIPSYFVPIEHIPLTPNGKIDKNALPEPRLNTGSEYEAPRNKLEGKLVELWSEVLLGEEADSSNVRIGRSHNFFILGGHSLKAIKLISRIHKELNVQVPLAEIFKNSTIRGLAEYIRGTVQEKYKSIRPVEEKEYYELSSTQKRLYFLQQMEPDSPAYNIPVIIPLSKDIDVEKTGDVFKRLIKRHDSLRTSFHMVNGTLLQRIHDDVEFRIEYSESLEFVQAFDLSKAPLMRVKLLKTGEGSRLLLIDLHHIITDGTSQEVLKQDFMLLYNGAELPYLRIQYKDFSGWQNSGKEKEELKWQELYWLKDFEGEIPVLNIPTDYPRPAVQSFEGNLIDFKIPHENSRSIMEYAREQGVTLYMFLLAAVNIMLSKLSGQEDIVIGTPVAGRRHADLEKIIGMFVNTLALRNYPIGQKSFQEFLKELKERTLEAFENQEYQFEDLVEKVTVNRDTGRNPLFDVMFVAQDISRLSGDGSEDGTVENGPVNKPVPTSGEYDNITRVSKFDLTITAVEAGQGLKIWIEYCTGLFKKVTVERFMIYFYQLLLKVIEEPGIKISEIEIISEEEKNRVLYDFNNTQAVYPKDKTIHELFEAQVEKTPDHIAVISPFVVPTPGTKHLESLTNENASSSPLTQITYNQLNEQSGRLAGMLREKGVQSDTVVGIMVEPLIETITGIFGILKSGSAYLPIDPDYPEERKQYMLADSGARILLTTGDTGSRGDPLWSPCPGNSTISLGGHGDPPLQSVSSAILTSTSTCQVSPTNLAYIIYTSGSTGRPKGVLVEHRSVVNYLWWASKNYSRGENANFPLYTSISFDLTVTSIFTPLINGNAIIVYGDHNNPIEIIEEIINDNRIDILKLTPAHLAIVKEIKMESTCKIKRFILGGENLESALASEVHKKFNGQIEIYNEYGPTEAAVGCMTYRYPGGEDHRFSVPIGIPADNVRIYLLDKYGHPTVPGAAGEIYIVGDGLARGYLNRPELTAEKFVRAVNSHLSLVISSSLKTNDRLYKTGDLAKWLPDGNIEFLGRIDNQVKIRGFRIELEEIECQLLKNKKIDSVVVTTTAEGRTNENEKEEKSLAAYIVSGDKISVEEIRADLMKALPDYMIPPSFIQVDKIPLTPNGKVDRKTLSSLGKKLETSEKYVLPQNQLQESIASAWKDILKLEKVGIYDNFFDLGGNSIKIIQVTNKLKQSLGIDVDIISVYRHTTIYSLAGYLEQRNKQEKAVMEAKGNEDNILIQIENYITGNYGIKAYYKKYLVDNDSYKVLYISRGLEDIEKLFQDLKEKFKDHYPNYIKFIESQDKIIKMEKIDAKSFSTAMGFVSQVTIQEKIHEELNKDIHHTSLLKKNNILRKYEVSSAQMIFLLNLEGIKRKNLNSSYDFAYPIEFEGLRKIAVKIINENSLLRSIIVKHSDTYCIEEFDSYSNIEIPFLDLSNYSFNCQGKIREIIDQHLEQPFDVIGNVLYRVVAVKFNENNYKLFFQFNHLVFDGGSYLVLQEQIDQAQKETPLDIEGKKKKIDYYDYATFLNNLKYDKIHLENYLPIPGYLESLEIVQKFFVIGDVKDDFFEIDLSILNAKSKAIYNEILLFNYARLIGSLWEIDNVPIISYSYGRNYKDGKFDRIIGTLLDFIPILLGFDRKNDSNFKYLLENLLDYREYIKKSNLNFTNFIKKKYREREEYLRLLSSPFKFNPLFGFYERFKIMSRADPSKVLLQNRFDADQMLIEMSASKDIQSDKVMIRFVQNTNFKIDRLKELFVKHFQEIAQYFNRKK